MAIAADGRLFVCTTISKGVTVISPDGEVLEEIHLGDHATNCIFDGLDPVRDRDPRPGASRRRERTGTFWRVETDAIGLPLIPGRL